MDAHPSSVVAEPATHSATMTVQTGQWRIVMALTLLAMLALLDKYALSLLVEPLKKDLRLTDTQVGLAVGAAFAVANIAAGLPAGWAADKFSRRRIVALGVVFWSGMTIACGMVGNFWQFFLARAGVGLGEGLIPPASYSLIRDGVSAERQGRAFGLFAMSNTLGPGAALLLGGGILALISAQGWDHLPLVGPVAPWQMLLVILGLAGMPLALLAFSFPEPPRRTLAQGTTFRDVLHLMVRERALYIPLIGFACLSAMIAAALGTWFPAFVGRSFGLQPGTIGSILGLLLICAGPLGVVVAGHAMDALVARGREGPGTVALVAACMIGTFGTLTPLVPNLQTMWVCEAGVILSSTSYLAIVSTIVARHSPGEMTGKVMAILLILQAIVGSGFAPVIVGLLADNVYGGSGALGKSLATCSIVLALGAIAFALRLRGVLAHRLQEAVA